MPLRAGPEYRTDGHCGAGAPRFNLTFDPTGPPGPQTLFFGCNSGMVPGDTQTPEGRMFQRRSTVGPFPSGTVISLAIVYDEGIEFPPPFVHLDDIQVGGHVWTSASDNGRG